MNDMVSIDAIFCTAIELESLDEQQSYLDRICGDNLELRRQVDRLIDAHVRGGSIVDSPAHVIGSTNVLPHTEVSGTQIGPFTLHEKIGEGGMGIVYAAEHSSLSRRVALKILPSASLWSANALERFRQEVRITATLEHPNIVPIYEMGFDRNVHFYAMKLVDGCSLADVITHRKQETESKASDANDAPASAETVVAAVTQTAVGEETWYRAVAKLGKVAASTLAFAHKRGVIHRDIKPSNLLLDRDGKLFIADFGLARFEADVNMTRTGDLMGTPRFMSPEQASGKSSKALDSRTDIFSLGSTLYELLTLKPVITATGPATAIRELQTLRPIPLRTHDPNIPLALERIVLKCLQLDPIDRYSGADELAKDLDRFLEGLAVVARPPGLVRRTSRWIQRHPQRTLSVIAGLCLSLIVLATGFWIVQRQSGESWLRGPASEELVDSSTTTNLPSDLKSPEESPDMLRSNSNNRNNENRRNEKSTNRSLKFEKLENRELMAQLTFGNPVNLGSGVNTPNDEWGATATKDGLSLMFARDIGWNPPVFLGIFEATRNLTTEPFGNAVSVGTGVNSLPGPSHPDISADGLALLFSDAGEGGIAGGRGTGLYQATRTSRSDLFGVQSPFSGVQSLGDLLPGQLCEGPSLSADRLTLFFSAWDTSRIQNDIYQAKRLTTSDSWGNVIKLGTEINTPDYNDAQPSISSDGLMLFFNSNRPGGFGGLDLYVSIRSSVNASWGNAVNLGPQVNTLHVDQSPFISVDGTTLYFHSSRPGGFGGEDLYQVAVGYANDTKFYVVNDGSPDRTFEYDATGLAIDNYAINSGNSAPRGAASTAAGDKVWVVDANRNVYVYGPNGNSLGSWSIGGFSASTQVEGIATNGTDVWIVDAKSDKVFKYLGAASRTSGSQNAASSFTFTLSSGNKSPKDIVTDGIHLWVVDDSTTDKVFKYTLNGSLVGSWTIDSANKLPTGLTIDPSGATQSIWIVDSGTDKVYEYADARAKTSGSQSASATFALAAGNTNPQGIVDPPPPGDSVRLPNAVMTPATASGLVAPMANSNASDIALSQLSDDIVRSRASRTFERGRADSEQSLSPPQSRNSVIAFSTQQFMQPARSENRASSQAKRLVGTTDDIFSNWSSDELKEFDL